MKMNEFLMKFQACFQESNWQYSSIGSDNGFPPNRRKAIIWTNDVLGCWRIYASLVLNKLKYHLGTKGNQYINHVHWD